MHHRKECWPFIVAKNGLSLCEYQFYCSGVSYGSYNEKCFRVLHCDIFEEERQTQLWCFPKKELNCKRKQMEDIFMVFPNVQIMLAVSRTLKAVPALLQL
ncbi:uncharacterized protein LOC112093179 [Morus notabilis]|uniref:uncharacterized protein LOC112093179 n=1 Tax=Morus notabilis TaxID=981085 RepID=UPI000CED155E|nr:uncharacterized protein LOC112093179 [Morus notabilis]